MTESRRVGDGHGYEEGDQRVAWIGDLEDEGESMESPPRADDVGDIYPLDERADTDA